LISTPQLKELRMMTNDEVMEHMAEYKMYKQNLGRESSPKDRTMIYNPGHLEFLRDGSIILKKTNHKLDGKDVTDVVELAMNIESPIYRRMTEAKEQNP